MPTEIFIIYQFLGDKTSGDGDTANTTHRTSQNSMTNDPDKVWPGGIVPYEIDFSVGKGSHSREAIRLKSC